MEMIFSVIDASGKLADGITSGGLWFTGSPDACIKVDTKGPPSNDTESFKGQYVMVAFGGPEDFPEEEAEEIKQMLSKTWKNGQALPRMPIFLPGPYLGIAGPSLGQIAGQMKMGFCLPDSCSVNQISRGLTKNFCKNINTFVAFYVNNPVTSDGIETPAYDAKDKIML